MSTHSIPHYRGVGRDMGPGLTGAKTPTAASPLCVSGWGKRFD